MFHLRSTITLGSFGVVLGLAGCNSHPEDLRNAQERVNGFVKVETENYKNFDDRARYASARQQTGKRRLASVDADAADADQSPGMEVDRVQESVPEAREHAGLAARVDSNPALRNRYRVRSATREGRKKAIGTAPARAAKTALFERNSIGRRTQPRLSADQRSGLLRAKGAAANRGLGLSSLQAGFDGGGGPSHPGLGWTYDGVEVYFDPYNYTNDVSAQVYSYYAPAGTSQIQVAFDWIDLEAGYDSVNIYDAYGLCATYTGRHADFQSSECLGDYVEIWVQTDSSRAGDIYDGFRIRGFFSYAQVEMPQYPPVAVGLADQYTAARSESVYFNGESSFDPDGPSTGLSYEWSFGDGSRSFERSTSHRYSTAGTYYVTLKVTDQDQRVGFDSFLITIFDRPPNARFSLRSTAISVSNPAVVTPEAGRDHESIDIAWGDGSSTYLENYVPSPGGVSHRYTAPGSYLIVLKATNGNGTATRYANLEVSGTALPPAVSVPNLAAIRSSYDRSYTVSPEFRIVEDGYLQSFEINWGGGSLLEGNLSRYSQSQLSSNGPTKSLRTSHEYFLRVNGRKVNRAGTYTVSARATDNEGAIHSASFEYRTKNTPPTIRGGNRSQCVSRSCSFTVGNGRPVEEVLTDSDGFIGQYQWDFFQADQVTPVPGCSTRINQLTGSCDFPADGSYSVRFRVNDEQGAFRELRMRVRVKNKPPRVSDSIASNCNRLTCTFVLGAGRPVAQLISDPDGSVQSYQWEFFDGNKATKISSCGTTVGQLNAGCTFPAAGSYQIRIRATDNLGLQTDRWKRISVRN